MTISYDNIRLIYEDEKNISILSIVQKRFNLGVAKDNQSYYDRNIYENILSNNVDNMLLSSRLFFVIVLHITILKDFSANQFNRLKAQTIKWLPRFILYAYIS